MTVGTANKMSLGRMDRTNLAVRVVRPKWGRKGHGGSQAQVGKSCRSIKSSKGLAEIQQLAKLNHVDPLYDLTIPPSD